MELGLSLGGDPSNKPFGFLAKERPQIHKTPPNHGLGLGFCMALGITTPTNNSRNEHPHVDADDADDDADDDSDETPIYDEDDEEDDGDDDKRVSVETPLQLDLLPLAPVPRYTPHQLFPWPSHDNGSSEGVSSGNMAARLSMGEERAAVSSPNSAASSFQMDFCFYKGGGGGNKRDLESAGNDVVEAERASSRASDDDENGLTRKKLRLSKEQSAYLEESFKEHNTLNPKQKLALAKQLNLRPRQVEVWFQNRRARTKLKQTEVDCEYLKRCCETLTEENRRLQKELQDLRALKTSSSNPFHMQLPATTLTMCPSCERVATAATTTTAAAAAKTTKTLDPKFGGSRPKLFYPFSQTHQYSSAS